MLECLPASGRADLLGFGGVEHLGQPWLPSSSGWEFVGGAGPWRRSLARGPYGWAQIATFVITRLLIVVLAAAVRDQLPRKRVSGLAPMPLGLLGVALMLAALGSMPRC